MTKYLCENPACVLGTRDNPGRFAGGISKEQVNLLTGEPVDQLVEGEHFGDGFCPNCGQQGREFDAAEAQAAALAEAKAAYDAQVAAITGGA